MSVYGYKYLSVDDEAQEVYYLGYPLDLTKRELLILCAILKKEAGIEKNEFCDIVASRRGSEKTLKTHICNINKKAEEIGGRKLILNEGGRYRLNEFM